MKSSDAQILSFPQPLLMVSADDRPHGGKPLPRPVGLFIEPRKKPTVRFGQRPFITGKHQKLNPTENSFRALLYDHRS